MTVLEKTVLDVLLPGFTHHIDIGQGADARISFSADGVARMVLPGKPAMQGVWAALPQGYHVAWTDGPPMLRRVITRTEMVMSSLGRNSPEPATTLRSGWKPSLFSRTITRSTSWCRQGSVG